MRRKFAAEGEELEADLLHEGLGVVDAALGEESVDVAAELEEEGVALGAIEGGEAAGREGGEAGEDAGGDLCAHHVGDGLVDRAEVFAVEEVEAKGVEEEVVVGPLVGDGVDGGGVGAGIADDGGVCADAADGFDVGGPAAAGFDAGLHRSDFGRGEVRVEEDAAGDADLGAGGDREDTGGLGEFDVDGGPEDVLGVEEGERAGEAGLAEGVADAVLEDALSAVAEAGALGAERGGFLCQGGAGGGRGRAGGRAGVDLSAEVEEALEVGVVSGSTAALHEIADPAKPAVEDGLDLEVEEAEAVAGDGAVDGVAEGGASTDLVGAQLRGADRYRAQGSQGERGEQGEGPPAGTAAPSGPLGRLGCPGRPARMLGRGIGVEYGFQARRGWSVDGRGRARPGAAAGAS